MHDYRNLEVFSKAHDLTLEVYRATRSYPDTERYGLVTQSRRSAASIGSNIAEGSARGTAKQFINFLSYAAGSASEIEYQLLLARDLGYLDPETYRSLAGEAAGIRQMLYRLQQGIQRRDQ